MDGVRSKCRILSSYVDIGQILEKIIGAKSPKYHFCFSVSN